MTDDDSINKELREIIESESENPPSYIKTLCNAELDTRGNIRNLCIKVEYIEKMNKLMVGILIAMIIALVKIAI